ncbi:GroES chaperonin [Candidatus Phytoplasma rubi]|uniref:10 kDa chaperonin n=1 Tax=Candidatus Phytoplasma rubi TaxID=399025 RepID=A0ABY7BVD4_9MOLU|nr:co-chaperone GroES [Candidatus Phytoplasma rubi]WAN63656.1 GroES chaperonin [Candidatus Phytoplasma rubi]
MLIKPLKDYVVIKHEEEKKNESSIILNLKNQTQENNCNNCTGIVVSCGPEASKEIQPNYKVVYENYAGTKITIEKEEYLILKTDKIIALLI